MIDSKLNALAIIKADSSVLSLVPSAQITVNWPTKETPRPCITVGLLNQSRNDAYDNSARGDDVELEVHIFGKPHTNLNAISSAVSFCLEGAGWWRFFANEITEPDNATPHFIMRFSTKFYD